MNDADLVTDNRLYALFRGFRDGDTRLMEQVRADQAKDHQRAQLNDAARTGRECLEELKR